MPYLETPPWARVADRSLLAVQYLASLAMGALTASLTTDPRMLFIAWVVTVTAVLCGVAAAVGRWEIESIGLLPLAGALASVLLILGSGPASPVWWAIMALVTALLRQYLRLFLQILRHIKIQRRLEALEA